MQNQTHIFNRLKPLLITSIQVILLALLTMFLCQFSVGCRISDIISSYVYVLYILVYTILFSIVYVVTGRITLSHGIVMYLLLAVSILDYQVYLFRGSEITFGELNLLETALGIAGNYTFTVTWKMFISVIVIVVVLFLLHRINDQKMEDVNRFRIWFLVISVCACFIVHRNIDNLPVVTFENNGMSMNTFPLNLIRQAYGYNIEEPQGYDTEQLNQVISQYTVNQVQKDELPDVIVIMNESFADLSCLGDLSIDDYIPYFHQIQSESVSGYMHVPAYGGGTANTEWEFLTGHTMHYLPEGTVSYDYASLTNSYSSIVRQMKGYGYHTIAMHPYYSYMYTRKAVFPKLGFDEQYFIDDFPQENMMREYVSDEEMYEQLIQRYESSDQKDPLFLFGITMQNHGPYDYEGENFTDTVDITGYGDYPKAQQYLTLMKESDQALHVLMDYFSSIDKPVILAFFGDHLPSIEQELYETIGRDLSSEAYQRAIHQVPFMIWSNQSNESITIDHISVNYFSSLILETAGIPLPAYNQFLMDVYQQFPLIAGDYLYSSEKEEYISYEELNDEDKKLITSYEGFVYNALCDDRNRLPVFTH